MSLRLTWFTVTLRDGTIHKVLAENVEAAEALVIFDREKVSPQNRQAEQLARPKVALFQEPLKAQPQVAGHFKVGDSMVTVFSRVFVKRG